MDGLLRTAAVVDCPSVGEFADEEPGAVFIKLRFGGDGLSEICIPEIIPVVLVLMVMRFSTRVLCRMPSPNIVVMFMLLRTDSGDIDDISIGVRETECRDNPHPLLILRGIKRFSLDSPPFQAVYLRGS